MKIGYSILLIILFHILFLFITYVIFKGKNSNPKVAMVFQNFALFPWLSVKENIELVIESLHQQEKEREAIACKYIKAVGLDGFERAYPGELSGGMKQRVGFARALAVEPVLLWGDPNMPPDAVIMVTHKTGKTAQQERSRVLSMGR